jgi:hypothetical protein
MPSRIGRARRLMAMAMAAACWLAVPAGASAQDDPALDVSGLTNAATGAVAATGSAVEDTATAAAPLAGPAQTTVTQVAGTVARATAPKGPVARLAASTADATGSVAGRVTRPAAPVAGVADQVASGVRRTVDGTLNGAAAVDDALHGATGVARDAVRDRGTAGAAAGQGSPRIERLSGPAAGGENLRASRLRLRGAGAAGRPYAALPEVPDRLLSPILTPLIPGPPIALPGAPGGGGETGSPAAAGSGALGLPSDTAPASGPAGGSSAAGASVSFSLGGLALLLATLSLAGPALRRRLPRRPVMGWPAAFVPLLERPG